MRHFINHVSFWLEESFDSVIHCSSLLLNRLCHSRSASSIFVSFASPNSVETMEGRGGEISLPQGLSYHSYVIDMAFKDGKREQILMAELSMLIM